MILKHVHRNKIHQEFVDAGLRVLVVSAINDSEIGADITFASGSDMDLIQAIIEAHDPMPLPAPLTQQDLVNNLGQQVAQLKLQIMLMQGSEK